MFTDEDLRRALSQCFVPALRRDVVSAGLLRSASLREDHKAPGAGIAGLPPRFVAHVVLFAPGHEDVLNAQVRAAVENRLLGVPEISRAEVTLTPALFPILYPR